MRRIAGAALLVAVLAACGTEDGMAGSRERPGPGPGSGAQPAPADPAARIEALGRSRYAASYSGLQVRDGELVVFRRPAPGFDEAVREAAGGTPVRFRDVPHAPAELQELRDRIEADLGFWRARGVPVSTVSVPPDGTAVDVGTPEPDRVRQEFRRRYGPVPPVRVTEVGTPVTAGP